jgi:hypothetical protein
MSAQVMQRGGPMKMFRRLEDVRKRKRAWNDMVSRVLQGKMRLVGAMSGSGR